MTPSWRRLGHQPAMSLFYQSQRTMSGGTVEGNRPRGAQDARCSNLGMLVFHPIRHLQTNFMFLAGGEVLNWLCRSQQFFAELDAGPPPLQIEFKGHGQKLPFQ